MRRVDFSITNTRPFKVLSHDTTEKIREMIMFRGDLQVGIVKSIFKCKHREETYVGSFGHAEKTSSKDLGEWNQAIEEV